MKKILLIIGLLVLFFTMNSYHDQFGLFWTTQTPTKTASPRSNICTKMVFKSQMTNGKLMLDSANMMSLKEYTILMGRIVKVLQPLIMA